MNALFFSNEKAECTFDSKFFLAESSLFGAYLYSMMTMTKMVITTVTTAAAIATTKTTTTTKTTMTSNQLTKKQQKKERFTNHVINSAVGWQKLSINCF